MKNVLITGATRGLGKYLSKFFLENDYFVYGTRRNQEKSINKNNFQFLELDLTDKHSIDKLSKFFTQSKKSIDVLIHNSAVAYLDPTDVLSDEEKRHIFDVNFFGPIYLTEKVLTLLKCKSRTDIFFISSIVSIDHWPHLGQGVLMKII